MPRLSASIELGITKSRGLELRVFVPDSAFLRLWWWARRRIEKVRFVRSEMRVRICRRLVGVEREIERDRKVATGSQFC